MKNKFLPLLLCICLSGCYVQSLNKFYTDNLKVELPEIQGEWIPITLEGRDASEDKLPQWKFTRKTIEIHDFDNKYSELKVVYFKIGNNLFMDFTAGEPAADSSSEIRVSYWSTVILPVHSLCRITISEDSLVMVPISFDWLEERDEALALSSVKTDNHLLFTASPEQWVEILKTHGDDEDLFDEGLKFEFKKAPALEIK